MRNYKWTLKLKNCVIGRYVRKQSDPVSARKADRFDGMCRSSHVTSLISATFSWLPIITLRPCTFSQKSRDFSYSCRVLNTDRPHPSPAEHNFTYSPIACWTIFQLTFSNLPSNVDASHSSRSSSKTFCNLISLPLPKAKFVNNKINGKPWVSNDMFVSVLQKEGHEEWKYV